MMHEDDVRVFGPRFEGDTWAALMPDKATVVVARDVAELDDRIAEWVSEANRQ